MRSNERGQGKGPVTVVAANIESMRTTDCISRCSHCYVDRMEEAIAWLRAAVLSCAIQYKRCMCRLFAECLLFFPKLHMHYETTPLLHGPLQMVCARLPTDLVLWLRAMNAALRIANDRFGCPEVNSV